MNGPDGETADRVAAWLGIVCGHPTDPTVRELLSVLARSEGAAGSADLVAQRVGLANRHALARRLRRRGLPPLSELDALARLFTWFDRWTTQRRSLCRQATDDAADPAPRYRAVRRVTGLPWSTVSRLEPYRLVRRVRGLYGSEP